MNEPIPDLSGKIALITGSSRGIGRAIAQRFAAAGATVVVTARSLAKPVLLEGTLDETVNLIEAAGGRAVPIACDLEDAGQCAGLIDAAIAAAGGLDILVNCAGYAHYAPIETMSDEIFGLTVDHYLRAPFVLSRAAIPHLRARGGGWILFVGSLTAQHATKPFSDVDRTIGMTAYAAVKAAVHRLTTGLAAELEADNIAVNLVAPSSGIKTPGAARFLENFAAEDVEYLAETALHLCHLPARERTGVIAHSLHYPVLKGFPVHSLDGRRTLPPPTVPEWLPQGLYWTNE